MVTNIKVVGYYGHSNAGDEQYKRAFKKILDENVSTPYNVQFIDCDVIKTRAFDEQDIIILGGGDVLNDYFLDTLTSKFFGKKNKIIAVSVGLPYLSTLTDTDKLQIIDYVFIRTKQDISLFSQYFEDRVFYLPDISFLLDNESTSHIASTLKSLRRKSKRNIVSVSLSRHIFNIKYVHEYNLMVDKLVEFTENILSMNCHIVFIPFNVNEDNQNENDNIIHKHVYDKLKDKSNVTFISSIQEHEILDLMNTCIDYTIAMRFHACLFSIYNRIPFFPIFTTRKIKNLLLDIEWKYGYECDVNASGIPIDIDIDVAFSRFCLMTEIDKSSVFLRSKLLHANKEFEDCLHLTVPKLLKVLNDKGYVKQKLKVSKTIETKLMVTLQAVQTFTNSTELHLITDPYIQEVVSSIVSYYLTSAIQSPYTYGLKTKMFTVGYDYKSEWTWIIKDAQINKTLLSNPNGLFNLGFIDQVDYSGSHRSGWQYVYENIKHLHNDDESSILLDMYIDRTFHWHFEINKIIGLLPYKKNWVGFIHHTFADDFSDYNCFKLLENNLFIESLRFCKGLFVLSDYLKQQLKTELMKKGVDSVPIHVFMHPTDTLVDKWSIPLFLKNKDKKLIHVGGWLRNVYSFYNLNLPTYALMENKSYCFNFQKKIFDMKLRKVALRGKNMNNYYPTLTFKTELYNFLVKSQNNDWSDDSLHSNTSQNSHSNISQNHKSCTSQNHQPCVSQNHQSCISQNHQSCISQNISQNSNANYMSGLYNNWYKHFFRDMESKIESVEFIEHINNLEYDKLLCENVIFIFLDDASAVNTVLECVVRNTPLIVNKHPAVVEILGNNYPLYVSNVKNNYGMIMMEVDALLREESNIVNAHECMKNINTKMIEISSFVADFENVMKTM